jgi:hypothetical protein
VKLSKHDKMHSIKSDHIYVIDKFTGEPVLYDIISNHEVIETLFALQHI